MANHSLYKFYIGQTEIIEQPKGWDSLEITLRRDATLHGLFKVMDVQLSFFADGYDILKQADETFGFTYSTTFEVRRWSDTTNAHIPIYTGTIFIKDCVFYEGIGGDYVKVDIQDNSFFSRIKNNKNLKSKIYVGKSKNNIDITPCPYQQIQYFNCPTGGAISILTGPGNERNNTAFKVYDALKYFIDFVSDGTVDFVSDTFGAGGLYEGYLITCGFLTRFVMGGSVSQTLFEENWPELDFAQVFTELDKEFNLVFKTGYNGSRPFFRIEQRDVLYTTNVAIDLPAVDKIERRKAKEFLYSKVKVGSKNVVNEPTLTSGPSGIRFVWFAEESYTVTGEANSETELDLVNEWIIDSNLIELLVEFGLSSAPTTYDQEIILIECSFISGTTWSANQSNWITGASTPVFYNESLNSNNKTSRYLGAIPSSIGIQLGIIDNTFSSQDNTAYVTPQSLTPVVLNPLPASVVNRDPGGNYNPTGYYYTAAQGGVNTFLSASSYQIDQYPGVSCIGHIEIFYDVYASTDTPGVDPPVLTIASTSLIGIAPACSLFQLIAQESINLAAGQRVALRIEMKSRDLSGTPYAGFFQATHLRPGTTFECTATSDGGGIYKTYDPEKIAIERSQFQYPLTFDEFLTIDANQTDLITYGTERGRQWTDWIEELRYNGFNNVGKFTTIGNKFLNQ